MQRKPLRVALVGCGRIGSFTTPRLKQTLPQGWFPLNHGEAILATPGLRLDSVCDIDSEHLAHAMEMFHVPGYRDYDRQIAETRPDIISIATRTAARNGILSSALQHGVRGIHCEKPIATNLGDCRQMLGAIAATGTKLTYGTTRRFMDIFRNARARIAAGEIGRLKQVEIQFGRALLMWTHPHSADVLMFFAEGGSPREVRANCTFPRLPSTGEIVEDDPFVEEASVVFDNGIVGRITAAAGMNVILTGSAGTMRIGDDGRWLEVSKKNGLPKRVQSNPQTSGTVRAFTELEQAIRSHGETSASIGDVEAGLTIVLAIAKSALEHGAPVAPGSIDPRFTVIGRYGQSYA